MQERLLSIKARLNRKNVDVCYVMPNPGAEYYFDTVSAKDDVMWMIAEIERLRLQVNDLSSPRGTAPLTGATDSQASRSDQTGPGVSPRTRRKRPPRA